MKSRKSNRSKSISKGCRNNGDCKHCEHNRTYSTVHRLPADIPVRRGTSSKVRGQIVHEDTHRDDLEWDRYHDQLSEALDIEAEMREQYGEDYPWD